MTHVRRPALRPLVRLTTLLSALALASCTVDDPNEPPPPATTGQVTVWTSDQSPSPIEVSIDGNVVGILTAYRTSPPACGSETSTGRITVTLPAGAHVISAEETHDDGYWPAKTVQVTGGGCLTFALNP
jgi:hypothetical protein